MVSNLFATKKENVNILDTNINVYEKRRLVVWRGGGT